ncbi:MAG: hypothetical protein M5U28_23475 [Sandaracinaceae bacterium]|nr:hypothetical protein [Sandaracinaceae bacterium]
MRRGCVRTGLTVASIELEKDALADALFERIPAGVGAAGASTSTTRR